MLASVLYTYMRSIGTLHFYVLGLIIYLLLLYSSVCVCAFRLLSELSVGRSPQSELFLMPKIYINPVRLCACRYIHNTHMCVSVHAELLPTTTVYNTPAISVISPHLAVRLYTYPYIIKYIIIICIIPHAIAAGLSSLLLLCENVCAGVCVTCVCTGTSCRSV